VPYKLDPSADISNTSLVEEVEVAPAKVVRALGAPHRRMDEYKVSGLYSFVDGLRVFTVYDWKATSLYDEDLPSPLAFWNCKSEVCLSIGSNSDDVTDFKRWLLERVLTLKTNS
jgi:hypothetical protein